MFQKAGGGSVRQRPSHNLAAADDASVAGRDRRTMLEVAVGDAQAMLDAARQAGVQLMYGENWVYAPSITRAIGLLTGARGCVVIFIEDDSRGVAYGSDNMLGGMESHLEDRVVRRPVDGPMGNNTWMINLNHPTVLDMPWGSGGMLGTARDVALFGQTFLNGGEYAGTRLLSPASVKAMTTNQIPGIGVRIMNHWIPEGSWGYGFMVQDNFRPTGWTGSLSPLGTFYHQGSGGIAFWCDPLNDVVGVFLSVWSHVDRENMEAHWDFDLFQNMVTAAVA